MKTFNLHQYDPPVSDKIDPRGAQKETASKNKKEGASTDLLDDWLVLVEQDYESRGSQKSIRCSFQ